MDVAFVFALQDFKDLFSTLVVSLPLSVHRLRFKTYMYTFTSDEAVNNLSTALDKAEERIARTPHQGLPAPRPYPKLTSADRLWIKEGRYWIAYRVSPEPMILGVFYESANIPGRL